MLGKYFENNHINIAFFPTAYFNWFVDSAISSLDHFKLVIWGGEKSNPNIVRKVLKRKERLELNNRLLVTAYGPTETTIYATYRIMDMDRTASDEDLCSIGKPIKHMKAYVLNKRRKKVKPGSVGELFLSGPGLAVEYKNNKQLTSKNFVKNPFETDLAYKKMYKTGDLVSLLPDGNYAFIERVDDQVKVRGYRAHISEIQEAITTHKKINQAVVIAKKDDSGNVVLVGYIKLRRKIEAITLEELMGYLKDRLPSWMIPSRFYLLDRYPLTLTGKIDKNKLIESRELTIMPSANMMLFPNQRSRYALKLTNIFARVTGSKVNPNKNFFDVGIKSLALSRICTAINKELSEHIDIMDLIKNPTINSLSKYMQKAEQATQG